MQQKSLDHYSCSRARIAYFAAFFTALPAAVSPHHRWPSAGKAASRGSRTRIAPDSDRRHNTSSHRDPFGRHGCLSLIFQEVAASGWHFPGPEEAGRAADGQQNPSWDAKTRSERGKSVRTRPHCRPAPQKWQRPRPLSTRHRRTAALEGIAPPPPFSIGPTPRIG